MSDEWYIKHVEDVAQIKQLFDEYTQYGISTELQLKPPIKVVADFSKGELLKLKTGAEWLDIFFRELGKPQTFVGYGYDSIGYEEDDVIEAAKKASGIE